MAKTKELRAQTAINQNEFYLFRFNGFNLGWPDIIHSCVQEIYPNITFFGLGCCSLFKMWGGEGVLLGSSDWQINSEAFMILASWAVPLMRHPASCSNRLEPAFTHSVGSWTQSLPPLGAEMAHSRQEEKASAGDRLFPHFPAAVWDVLHHLEHC